MPHIQVTNPFAPDHTTLVPLTHPGAKRRVNFDTPVESRSRQATVVDAADEDSVEQIPLAQTNYTASAGTEAEVQPRITSPFEIPDVYALGPAQVGNGEEERQGKRRSVDSLYAEPEAANVVSQRVRFTESTLREEKRREDRSETLGRVVADKRRMEGSGATACAADVPKSSTHIGSSYAFPGQNSTKDKASETSAPPLTWKRIRAEIQEAHRNGPPGDGEELLRVINNCKQLVRKYNQRRREKKEEGQEEQSSLQVSQHANALLQSEGKSREGAKDIGIPSTLPEHQKAPPRPKAVKPPRFLQSEERISQPTSSRATPAPPPPFSVPSYTSTHHRTSSSSASVSPTTVIPPQPRITPRESPPQPSVESDAIPRSRSSSESVSLASVSIPLRISPSVQYDAQFTTLKLDKNKPTLPAQPKGIGLSDPTQNQREQTQTPSRQNQETRETRKDRLKEGTADAEKLRLQSPLSSHHPLRQHSPRHISLSYAEPSKPLPPPPLPPPPRPLPSLPVPPSTPHPRSPHPPTKAKPQSKHPQFQSKHHTTQWLPRLPHLPIPFHLRTNTNKPHRIKKSQISLPGPMFTPHPHAVNIRESSGGVGGVYAQTSLNWRTDPRIRWPGASDAEGNVNGKSERGVDADVMRMRTGAGGNKETGRGVKERERGGRFENGMDGRMVRERPHLRAETSRVRMRSVEPPASEKMSRRPVPVADVRRPLRQQDDRHSESHSHGHSLLNLPHHIGNPFSHKKTQSHDSLRESADKERQEAKHRELQGKEKHKARENARSRQSSDTSFACKGINYVAEYASLATNPYEEEIRQSREAKELRLKQADAGLAKRREVIEKLKGKTKDRQAAGIAKGKIKLTKEGDGEGSGDQLDESRYVHPRPLPLPPKRVSHISEEEEKEEKILSPAPLRIRKRSGTPTGLARQLVPSDSPSPPAHPTLPGAVISPEESPLSEPSAQEGKRDSQFYAPYDSIVFEYEFI
ncbi:uncharacterized protein EI97DRAFT_454293 [Westerdykella ornata]|uniref:Uncharacterized protein n=1 Tax=Westerdykella ornata TaxID=318751 RepID=A0A6A6JXY5_WESOR|nr:uncharacterized protein EI97DRAFT_454293 [Westerdykella ornata]KAF2281075.1 hypothetical protein EI97DRAFT_454293 [Westerdykella ornata]